MRKVLALMGLLSVLGFGSSSAADQKDKAAKDAHVTTLDVKGMACSACAAKVERTARRIDGVSGAKVDARKGTATITFDAAKTNPDAIAKIITDESGFKAQAPKKPQS